MTIYKCKMCGGTLEILEGSSIATCEFCDTKQTLPTIQDEGLQNLFNRANVLRMKSEFDKASEIYDRIIQKSPEEAEAYWGLILCKYGIEYVEDPNTYKRIPTCHRASYDAVSADDDYKSAIQYADMNQRAIYEQEAKTIEEVQKGIITLAQQADPYDVFICYKETDEDGKRTQDSVIANDIYYQLTQEGFKVFYAAITLEDKLGSEYEPYIFSALNSSKVLLAIGTKPDYFNAVWVKNEWSRFLKIIKKDRSKLLIPCYKDMDAYELPEEFAHLQAQDMSKIGFINDVVRGIKKVIVKEEKATSRVVENTIIQNNYSSNVTALLDRGNMALEDSEWDKADVFFEDVLNQAAKCAEAYVGKLLAANKAKNLNDYFINLEEKYASAVSGKLYACEENLVHISESISANKLDGYLDEDTIKKEYDFDRSFDSYLSCREDQRNKQLAEIDSDRLLTRARQYSIGDVKNQIESGIKQIESVLEERILCAKREDETNVSEIIEKYEEYIRSADKKVLKLREKADLAKSNYYNSLVADFDKTNRIESFESLREKFGALDDYEDSIDMVKKCQEEIGKLTEKELKEKAKKKRNRIIIASFLIAVVCLAVITVKFIIPYANYKDTYQNATALMESGNLIEAANLFDSISDYKNSTQMSFHCMNLYYQTFSVGDTFEFGVFEGEPLNWLVLEREENRMLVISVDGIAEREYSHEKLNGFREGITWETSSLRKWLNDDFYYSAFSETEQSRVASVTVLPASNPDYATDAGRETEDKVFLLSVEEVELYFDDYELRLCEFDGQCCAWWLRSPGVSPYRAAVVYSDGRLIDRGFEVGLAEGVRPVMWLELNSVV